MGLKALRMGIESFGQYGKLIGTGKNNGLKVFESLSDCKRILTTVDTNGKVVKTVTTQEHSAMNVLPESIIHKAHLARASEVHITDVARADGSSDTFVRAYFNQDVRYRRMIKNHADGSYESFTAYAPGYNINHIPTSQVVDGEFIYTARSAKNGDKSDFITFECNSGSLNLQGKRITDTFCKDFKNKEFGYKPDLNGIYRGHSLTTHRPRMGSPKAAPAYESPYYLSDEVNIPVSGIKGHVSNTNGAQAYHNDGFDRNTGSKLLQNMYEYINKLRGVKV